MFSLFPCIPSETSAKIGPAPTGCGSRLGVEEGPVVLIQIVAALLLLAGSALIFRALLALDAPAARPRLIRRLKLQPPTRGDEADSLRRAA